MDEWQYEQAEQRSQAARDDGIERARKALNDGPNPIWYEGDPFCAECGDYLPLPRAEAGRGRCVDCQTEWEQLEAMAGKPIC